ncbi:RICIN domain-containing protein [Streptomyces sp. NPDC059788]|uniref:RICIN domain-containing protein n=1 Tax=Streptomyces sp. NPDC059788 TaxID=3346948 RepID=UPI003659C7D6
MRAKLGTAGALAALGISMIVAPSAHAADPVNNKQQSIHNEQTGLCLDGDYEGKVYTKACTPNNKFQQWTPVFMEAGAFKLRHAATGMCLTLVNREMITNMGCSDYYYPPQAWYLVHDGNANMLTTVYDGVLDSDAKGNVYPKDRTHNNRYQSWIFTEPR